MEAHDGWVFSSWTGTSNRGANLSSWRSGREVAASNIVENNSDGWAKLLRDEKDPAHFISLAEWPDVHMVGLWFESDGFKRRRDELEDLIESVTPGNFSQEAAV